MHQPPTVQICAQPEVKIFWRRPHITVAAERAEYPTSGKKVRRTPSEIIDAHQQQQPKALMHSELVFKGGANLVARAADWARQ
jgi:hypothetical protein